MGYIYVYGYIWIYHDIPYLTKPEGIRCPKDFGEVRCPNFLRPLKKIFGAVVTTHGGCGSEHDLHGTGGFSVSM